QFENLPPGLTQIGSARLFCLMASPSQLRSIVWHHSNIVILELTDWQDGLEHILPATLKALSLNEGKLCIGRLPRSLTQLAVLIIDYANTDVNDYPPSLAKLTLMHNKAVLDHVIVPPSSTAISITYLP